MEEITIEGLSNWEVVQQCNGIAEVKLHGLFTTVANTLIARVFNEYTDEPVIEWKNVTVSEHTWLLNIKIPAGGPYRLEIRHYDGMSWKACGALAGCIHHFCVGDVYLIAGQSNAAGKGHGEMLEAPEIGVHTLRDCRYWDLATNPLYAERGHHSPFLSFGKRMKKALGYPIGLIPCAYGGSSLAQWLPDEDGIFYRKMLESIAEKKIKGILWYQGETDAMQCAAENYFYRFRKFLNFVRTDLHDENLPIITVQLGRHTDDFENSIEMDLHYDMVREAQRQAARMLKNVYIVPAIDIGRMSDGIHNSKSANLLLADRMARMALYKLYDKGLDPSAPDLEHAECVLPNKILLKFMHVDDTLMAYHITNPARLPIQVEDEQGINRIIQFEICKDEIVLVCERDIAENTYIKCQYAKNPLNIIQDFDKQIAVLCFSNVKVERNRAYEKEQGNHI